MIDSGTASSGTSYWDDFINELFSLFCCFPSSLVYYINIIGQKSRPVLTFEYSHITISLVLNTNDLLPCICSHFLPEDTGLDSYLTARCFRAKGRTSEMCGLFCFAVFAPFPHYLRRGSFLINNLLN